MVRRLEEQLAEHKQRAAAGEVSIADVAVNSEFQKR